MTDVAPGPVWRGKVTNGSTARSGPTPRDSASRGRFTTSPLPITPEPDKSPHQNHCAEPLGVAIHHGALPTAFRKEVERLLREGVLKVTISSPTLAQGLN